MYILYHRCKIPNCEDVTNFKPAWLNLSAPSLGEDSDSVKQCQRYAVIGEECVFDNNTLQQCDEWLYEVPDSFVAEVRYLIL